MQQQRPAAHHPFTQSRQHGPDSATATPASEDIHVRNYDHEMGYVLDLKVVRPSEGPVVQKRFYLEPGEVVSEFGLVSSAEYELRAELENGNTERRECRIGTAPDHTAVIEVGNGALSITEGFTA
jgi:hypothetical protein